MELWQVIARESIRDLVSRYNSYGDAGRFEPLMELFAVDAVMELADRTCTGRDEIATIFTGARDRVRGGEAPGYVRHFGATHQINLDDESSANGRLYFAVLTPSGLDHWGRYIDRYRVVDGEWRFAHRKVVVDGSSPGSIFG
jgi:SnoaL-like domain